MTPSSPKFNLGDLLREATWPQAEDQSAAGPALSDAELIALCCGPEPSPEVSAKWLKRLLVDRALRDQLTRLFRAGKIHSIPWAGSAGSDSDKHEGKPASEQPSLALAPRASGQALRRSPPEPQLGKTGRRYQFGRYFAVAVAASILLGAVFVFTRKPADPAALLARGAEEIEQQEFEAALQTISPLLEKTSSGVVLGKSRTLAEEATYQLLKREREAGKIHSASQLLADAQAHEFDSARLNVEYLQARRGLRTLSAFDERGLADDFPSKENPAGDLRPKFEHALQKYPADPTLRLNFVHWLLERGNLEAAQSQLASLRSSPHLALAAGIVDYQRAVHSADGDHAAAYHNALRHFESVLASDRNDAAALFNAGKMNRLLKQPQKARAYLLQAREHGPDQEFQRRVDAELEQLPPPQ